MCLGCVFPFALVKIVRIAKVLVGVRARAYRLYTVQWEAMLELASRHVLHTNESRVAT